MNRNHAVSGQVTSLFPLQKTKSIMGNNRSETNHREGFSILNCSRFVQGLYVGPFSQLLGSSVNG